MGGMDGRRDERNHSLTCASQDDSVRVLGTEVGLGVGYLLSKAGWVLSAESLSHWMHCRCPRSWWTV